MDDQLDFSSKTWSEVSKKSKSKQNANQSSRHFTSVQCSSKSPIPNNFMERNRTKIVYNHELFNNLKDNEIKNANANELKKSQKHIVPYKSKNNLQSSEEKNIKEQLQKSKTISNDKLFLDKRKNTYYDVFKSKISEEEIVGVSKVPEVEIKRKQYKEDYKTKSRKVILQNHYCNVSKGCIENNVNSHSTNIGISSSSDFPKLICPSSHVKDLKEDNNNKNQEVNKNDSYTVLVEHKSKGISKTREEIIQQRRIKVAARKKAKKTAIKQQKEEEYLKRSTSAKYQGVTMINNQDNVKENWEVTKENVSIAELSDFPCLGSIGKKKTMGKCLDKISQEVIRNGKPKKMDPIIINILDAISHKKIERKPVVTVTKSRLNLPLISGNSLDGDNPQRKRGKIRLGKKAKPSRLKAHILKVRQEKLNVKNSASVSLNETKMLKLTNEEAINCQFLLPLASFKHPDCLETVKNDGVIRDLDSSITSLTQDDDQIVRRIHTRRFREYCDNTLTPPLVESICSLLTAIVKFQDRLYARDPIKAHAKRRYVTGLREAEKYLKLSKVKLLIIAPDLEKISGEHGLDAIVLRLKEEAQRKFVPYVFGPNRKKLGYCTFKKQISAIAILKYEGAEDQFTQVVSLLNEARVKYKTRVDELTTQPEHETKKDNITTIVDQNKVIQSEIITSFLDKLRLKDEEEVDLGISDIHTAAPFYMALEKH